MKAKIRLVIRHGYAMTLVLVFLILLLSVLGVTFRQLATVMRMEAYRSSQIVNSQASLTAAAQGLTLLQQGSPPSDPYSFEVNVTTALGTSSYTVVIASAGVNQWTVSASPTN